MELIKKVNHQAKETDRVLFHVDVAQTKRKYFKVSKVDKVAIDNAVKESNKWIEKFKEDYWNWNHQAISQLKQSRGKWWARLNEEQSWVDYISMPHFDLPDSLEARKDMCDLLDEIYRCGFAPW